MDIILRGILLLIEGFVLGNYLDFNLTLKRKNSKFKLVGTIIIIIFIINALLAQFEIIYPNLKALPLKVLIVSVALLITAKLFSRDKLIHIMLKLIIYTMLQVAVEMSVLSSVTLFFGITMEQLVSYHKSFYLVIGLICTSILYVVTWVVSHPKMLKKKFSWGYGGIIMGSNICIILLFFGMVSVYEYGAMGNNILLALLGMCIVLAILNVFNFYMYLALEKQHQKENEYKLIRHASEGQFKYIMQNEKSVKIVRKVKHDLSNQMIGLKYLLEQSRVEEAKQYIHSIHENLESAQLRDITGFPIVDAVLNQKYEVCKDKEIQLITHIGKIEEIQMTPQDQCVILGNALDNAIEACERIPEVRRRMIEVNLYCNKGYFICIITNTHAGEVSLKTSKDKEWHGIGLKSIKEVTHSYNGEVYIEVDEEEFKLKVTMPLGSMRSKKGSCA